MSKNILVGFDGSGYSQSAARMAGWLAKKSGATVVLIRAVVPPAEQLHPDLPRYSTLAAEFKAGLTAVDAEVAALARCGVHAEGTVVVGEPVRRLMRAVIEKEPILLAVGTFGCQPIADSLFGGVADKLARTSPVPVLLMPQDDYEPPAPDRRVRVLVPLDGSNPAKAALMAVDDLFSGITADTTLLEVIEHRPTTPVQVANTPNDGAVPGVLMDILPDLRARDMRPDVALRVGQPARQIVQYAQDGSFDLIALTRCGLGMTPQMLLGRVAEGVVRQSPLPVLVVPPLWPGMTGKSLATDAITV